jgi:hypothetical protein
LCQKRGGKCESGDKQWLFQWVSSCSEPRVESHYLSKHEIVPESCDGRLKISLPPLFGQCHAGATGANRLVRTLRPEGMAGVRSSQKRVWMNERLSSRRIRLFSRVSSRLWCHYGDSGAPMVLPQARPPVELRSHLRWCLALTLRMS